MDRVPEGLDPAVQSREITFEADVTSVTPFLKLATVNRGGAGHMTFACDEGPNLGGLGSAPTPLMYFSAALAFWLMTQVARYGHMLKVNVTRMTMHVKASFRLTGSVLNDTVEAEMLGAETRLELDSPDPSDRVARVVRNAERGCFVMQALLRPVNVMGQTRLNGRLLPPTIDPSWEEQQDMPTVIDRRRVQQLVQQGAQLVDVLGAKEYEAEHIPGAINIPLRDLNRKTISRLESGRPVITYCHDYQWDLSARAASRLTGLGFSVYRYQAGKMDWFAAGLPREGTDANVPRVGDVAKRDVSTCRVEERVGDVRERLRANGRKPVVVVDTDRVVLGLIGADSLTGEPSAGVEDVMDQAPVTFRPNLRVGDVPEYLKKERVQHALVTTNDGILVGLIEP